MGELIDELENYLQQFVGSKTTENNKDKIMSSAHTFLEDKRPTTGIFGYHVSVTHDDSEILKVEVIDTIQETREGKI